MYIWAGITIYFLELRHYKQGQNKNYYVKNGSQKLNKPLGLYEKLGLLIVFVFLWPFILLAEL